MDRILETAGDFPSCNPEGILQSSSEVPPPHAALGFWKGRRFIKVELIVREYLCQFCPQLRIIQGAENFCSLLQGLPQLDYRCLHGHNCPVLPAFILWPCLGLSNHFICLSNFLNQQLLHSSRTLCCLFFKEILPIPRVSGISDCPG